MLRFLYLNLYSFLLFLTGVLAVFLPLYKINIWALIIQGIIALCLFISAVKLLAAWDDKKRKIAVLLGKNSNEIQPETFCVFMQAPCGRLVARFVLSELGKSHEYKELIKMKKPFLEAAKENCLPVKTVIYINKEVPQR
jgi:hypothetical protein